MAGSEERLRASGCAAVAAGVLAWVVLFLVVPIALAYGAGDHPIAIVYIAVLLLGPVAGAIGSHTGRSVVAGWGYAGLVAVSLMLGSSLG